MKIKHYFPFSCWNLRSTYSVAKATLELQMSVCLLLKPIKPLRFMHICHHAYLLISQMVYHAYWSLCLSTIRHMSYLIFFRDFWAFRLVRKYPHSKLFHFHFQIFICILIIFILTSFLFQVVVHPDILPSDLRTSVEVPKILILPGLPTGHHRPLAVPSLSPPLQGGLLVAEVCSSGGISWTPGARWQRLSFPKLLLTSFQPPVNSRFCSSCCKLC